MHAIILDVDNGSTDTVSLEEVSEPHFSTAPNSPMPSTESQLLHMSLNAAQGTPDELTISLLVNINGHKAVALVDSGSSCSFMTYNLAVQTNQNMMDIPNMKVTAADGGTLYSNKFVCPTYDVQGQSFSTPFRLINLKSYDMILGADWMKKFGPV